MDVGPFLPLLKSDPLGEGDADGVVDPETQVSVRERARAKMRVDGASSKAKPDDKENAKLAATGGDLPIGALGSGSDYSAFLQHLGIASLNLGFSGEEDQNGVYHSRYDSFDHYVRFGDPDFAYGVSLSKVAGHTALRLADADVLPLRFGDFARRHLQRDLGAAFLAAGAARQGRQVEPFMRFDQVDVDTATARRKGHSKLEQGIDIAGFGVGKAAPKQEIRALLTNRPHHSNPPKLMGPSSAAKAKKWLTRFSHQFSALKPRCCR